MNTSAKPDPAHVLLNLLRLSVALDGARATVVPAPLEDMLGAAFAGLVDQQGRAPRVVLSLPDDGRRPSPVASAQQLVEILRGIEHFGVLEREDALLAAAGAIDQALAVSVMAGIRSVEQATLLIDDLAVFDYLSTVVIEPPPEGPTVVLVGKVPSSLGQLLVNVPGRELQLRKTQLAYTQAGDYPQLDVWLPSLCGDAGLQINRTGWTQHDTPDARLELYTHTMRYFGQIYTVRMTLPYRITGARVGVTIAAQTGASLLATHFLDGVGRELACVVKVVQR